MQSVARVNIDGGRNGQGAEAIESGGQETEEAGRRKAKARDGVGLQPSSGDDTALFEKEVGVRRRCTFDLVDPDGRPMTTERRQNVDLIFSPKSRGGVSRCSRLAQAPPRLRSPAPPRRHFQEQGRCCGFSIGTDAARVVEAQGSRPQGRLPRQPRVARYRNPSTAGYEPGDLVYVDGEWLDGDYLGFVRDRTSSRSIEGSRSFPTKSAAGVACSPATPGRSR